MDSSALRRMERVQSTRSSRGGSVASDPPSPICRNGVRRLEVTQWKEESMTQSTLSNCLSAGILGAFALAPAVALADLSDLFHRGVSQSGEQKDMRRVGHVDLQGRPSYQPNVIVYPDGRTIAFAG